jgi:CMP-N,N'-diacetyllegionaminic acid synthase
MIDSERVVSLIPARGGSKTVPRKNVREVGDKPLIGWSIETAHETPAIDRTIVSTDDEEIARVAREFDAEVLDRPDRLATDDALVADTVRHAVDRLGDAGESASYVAMLEPTCPFRSPDDVQNAVERLVRNELDSVASFAPAELNPHRAWQLDANNPEPFVDGTDPWQPRQQLPDAYQLNGGVYAFAVDALPDEGAGMLFGDQGAVQMPPERSVDIDTPLDLELARLVANRDNNIRDLE